MKQNKIELSKIDDHIHYSRMCCSDLNKMLYSEDYTQRKELQNTMFEDGIVYDRQKNECRGLQVNEFASAAVAMLSKNLATLAPEVKKIFIGLPSAQFERSREHFQPGKTPELLQVKHYQTLIKPTLSSPTPLAPLDSKRIRKNPLTILPNYALILQCDFNSNIVTMWSSSRQF